LTRRCHRCYFEHEIGLSRTTLPVATLSFGGGVSDQDVIQGLAAAPSGLAVVGFFNPTIGADKKAWSRCSTGSAP
jgi:hypothetical protein